MSKAREKILRLLSRLSATTIARLHDAFHNVFGHGAHCSCHQAGGSSFSFIQTWERKVKKWRATEKNFTFKLTQPLDQSQRSISAYQQLLYDAINSLILRCKQETSSKPNDKVVHVFDS